jgi:hypothetical protein
MLCLASLGLPFVDSGAAGPVVERPIGVDDLATAIQQCAELFTEFQQ